MSDPLAPFLRNESVSRMHGGRPAPVRACGFVLKPAAAGGYANRLLPHSMVLIYILRGSGSFTDCSAMPRRVGAGDLVVLPAGKRHGVQQDADGQWAEAYVTMDGGFGQLLLRLGTLDAHHAVLRPGLDVALVQRFERILLELAQLPDYALPDVLLSAHELITAAAQLHRQQLVPDRQQRIIESACALLCQQLENRLDIQQLAATLDMSYERFRKLFRQRVGMSPGDYRIRRRIDRARALIGEHRMSNKQVAYELGYPDPFTFSKQFHKVTGRWPDDYRRRPVV